MSVLLLLYYFFWIINIVFAFVKRKSRTISLLTTLLLFYIFVSNNCTIGDAFKYKADYETNAYGMNWAEIGYSFLKSICRSVGFDSYNSFLAFVFIACALLIYTGIKKFNGNFQVLFAVCMCYIVPALFTAVRFFIALSIIVFSLHDIYDEKKIRFLLFVLIATSIHSTAIIFLILLLFRNEKNCSSKTFRTTLEIAIFCAISFCILFILVMNRFPLLNIIISLASRIVPSAENKIRAYFFERTRYGFLLLFVIYVINWLWATTLERQNYISGKKTDCYRLCCFAKDINTLLAVTLPFCMYNMVFFRLLIIGSIIDCVAFGVTSESKETIKSKTLYCSNNNILMVCSILSWCTLEWLKINSISISNMISSSLFGDNLL